MVETEKHVKAIIEKKKERSARTRTEALSLGQQADFLRLWRLHCLLESIRSQCVGREFSLPPVGASPLEVLRVRYPC